MTPPNAETMTPWGETLAELAEAALAAPDAPPRLTLTAFKAKHGDYRELAAIVGAALDLIDADGLDSDAVPHG